ncbi:hypothetical protein SAMN05444162_1669 [Paenibacillaceae bacterium GAS479]|nr:hypothetical protein SAMN05444162_1669 [Paenibacillaceae bacterium GAS479]
MVSQTQDMLHGKIGLLKEMPEGIRMQASARELAENPETALLFLSRYAELIPSPSIEPAATYFPSWIRSITGSVHYLTASGAGSVSLDPEDWQMVLYKPEDVSYASIGFICSSIRLEPTPIRLAAPERQLMLEQLYGGLLSPMFKGLASGAGVRVTDLWRLFASSLNNTRTGLLDVVSADSELKEAMEQDFNYVTGDMPGETFGERRNPLAIRFTFIDSPYKPGTQMAMRGACCLAFKTDYAKYCYHCPRLKPQERSRMYDEICGSKSS